MGGRGWCGWRGLCWWFRVWVDADGQTIKGTERKRTATTQPYQPFHAKQHYTHTHTPTHPHGLVLLRLVHRAQRLERLVVDAREGPALAHLHVGLAPVVVLGVCVGVVVGGCWLVVSDVYVHTQTERRRLSCPSSRTCIHVTRTHLNTSSAAVATAFCTASLLYPSPTTAALGKACCHCCWLWWWR